MFPRGEGALPSTHDNCVGFLALLAVLRTWALNFSRSLLFTLLSLVGESSHTYDVWDDLCYRSCTLSILARSFLQPDRSWRYGGTSTEHLTGCLPRRALCSVRVCASLKRTPRAYLFR